MGSVVAVTGVYKISVYRLLKKRHKIFIAVGGDWFGGINKIHNNLNTQLGRASI